MVGTIFLYIFLIGSSRQLGEGGGVDLSPGVSEQDAEAQRGWVLPIFPLLATKIFSHYLKKQADFHNFFLSPSSGKPLPSFPFPQTALHLTLRFRDGVA